MFETGTIMRTVARAPRLRRNGSGSRDGLGGSLEPISDTVATLGGDEEIRGAPDESTAGNPIIVFLRGGLEEYAVFTSGFGGGVTTGGADGDLSTGGTNPCIVGRADGLGAWGTDMLACDESRRGRDGDVEDCADGGGVTTGAAVGAVPALSPTSRIAAASQGASARRIANEHAISRSTSLAGTTSVRPAPYMP